jgi:hypothetical protein
MWDGVRGGGGGIKRQERIGKEKKPLLEWCSITLLGACFICLTSLPAYWDVIGLSSNYSPRFARRRGIRPNGRLGEGDNLVLAGT